MDSVLEYTSKKIQISASFKDNEKLLSTKSGKSSNKKQSKKTNKDKEYRANLTISKISKESTIYYRKECFDDNDDNDPYDVDLSMLKNLPKSIILEAIEYAKAKRREEEELEREKEDYKRLKCIPPWAKTYGGKQVKTCATTSTQYEVPSIIKLAEMEGESEERTHELEKSDEDESVQYVISGSKVKKGKRQRKDEDIHETIIESKMVGDVGEKRDKSRVKSFTDDVQVKMTRHPVEIKKDEKEDSVTDVAKQLSPISSSDTSILTDESKESELNATLQELVDSESLVSLRVPQTVSEKQVIDEKWVSEIEYDAEKLKEVEKEELDEEIEEEEASVEGMSDESFECEEEDEEVKQKKGRFSSKDTTYLKGRFGHILPKILAEIAWKRPVDPVHYLAHRLYCERSQQEVNDHMICMRASLKNKRETMLLPSGEMEPIKTFGFFERNIKGITMDNAFDVLLEEQEEGDHHEDEADEEEEEEGVVP